MALSEAFPPTRSTQNIPRNIPARRATEAITAVDLVNWTYAEQKPHKGGEMMMSNAGGISQTGIVIEQLLRGCMVDTSASGSGLWGSVHCQDDALTVHGITETLPGCKRALLIRYGEARCAPDWQPMIMPLRKVPVPGRKGQPRGIYKRNGKTRIATEMTFEGDWPDRATADRERAAWRAHCRDMEEQGVKHDWRPWPTLRCADEVIANARQVYREWYEALWALCDGLEAAGRRGLTKYRIAALGASYEPWRA